MPKIINNMLHRIHRAIYLLTAIFSRSGIDRFLTDRIRELNNAPDKYENILNVGSGGFVSRSINSIKCKKVLNIDIDPDRNPDMVVDVSKMDQFENNSFDAVFMVEVLEHVTSPTEAIKEIHRTLRKDGMFVLTTPFIFEMHDCPFDYYRFTKYGLELLLSEFSSVKIEARNKYLDTIVVLCMRLFVSKYIGDKIIATALIVIILGLYPLIWLAN
ncbi:class I SAM-dependent methyltransferase, partial [bacterium]|nr:class I SAM-dependent methyltransferase [bacterium]